MGIPKAKRVQKFRDFQFFYRRCTVKFWNSPFGGGGCFRGLHLRTHGYDKRCPRFTIGTCLHDFSPLLLLSFGLLLFFQRKPCIELWLRCLLRIISLQNEFSFNFQINSLYIPIIIQGETIAYNNANVEGKLFMKLIQKITYCLVNVSGTTVPFINTEIRLVEFQTWTIFCSTWSCHFVFYFLGIFLQQLIKTVFKIILALIVVHGGVPPLTDLNGLTTMNRAEGQSQC